MCNWVTMLGSRKLTEHCKPAIMKKKKSIKKKRQRYWQDALNGLASSALQKVPRRGEK